MRALLALSLLALSCTAPQAPDALKSHLTFFASFDAGMDAEVAAGDPRLYVAPSPEAFDRATSAAGADSLVRLEPGGRAGQALRFATDWNPIVFFHAAGNVAYQSSNWQGTFSFWMRIDPDNELNPGYSDPFAITDKNWDDSSLFVDFTEEDTPRHFRFAAFADKPVWNPDSLSWEEVPFSDRPMIDLADAPFGADRWTHVVLVFDGFNTGTPSGRLVGYINGERAGTLEGRVQTITWDPSRTWMMLGRHYTGAIDEVAVFDRALTDAEVRDVYRLPAEAWR